MRRSTLCLTLIITMVLCLMALPAFAQGQPAPGDPLLKALDKDYDSDEPLLPPNAKVVAEYRETAGEPIGSIDFVENEAYVIHKGDPGTAFKAQKSKPIYSEDTLVAMPSSRLVVLLKDQSQFSLGASSKLTLEKSLYDPDAGTRDTVVAMMAGKARFVVTKLGKGKDNDFQVKTPLAVIGVRGSDFVVAFVPEAALPTMKQRSWLDFISFASVAHAQSHNPVVVLSGPNTTLNFTGPTGPPVILHPFQISMVRPGMPFTPPLNVTPSSTSGCLNNIAPPRSVMSMPPVFE